MVSENQFTQEIQDYLIKHYGYSEECLRSSNDEELQSVIMYSRSGFEDENCVHLQVGNYYKKYMNGTSVCKLAYEINIELRGKDTDSCVAKLIKDGFDNNRVMLKLINKDRNKERIEYEEIPHREFLDYYVVYMIGSRSNIGHMELSVEVSYERMMDLETTEQELYEKAYKNTKDIAGFKVDNVAIIEAENIEEDRIEEVLMEKARRMECDEYIEAMKLLISTAKKSVSFVEFISKLVDITGILETLPDDKQAKANDDFAYLMIVLNLPDITGVQMAIMADKLKKKDVSVLRQVFAAVTSGEPYLYVIMAEQYKYGAAGLLYTEYLEQIAKEIGYGELVVIPSSTHEILVSQYDEECWDEETSDLIASVNKQIPEADVLGERAFIYNVGDMNFRPLH